jgi:GntR family transcriptional regulator, arabinose operon transcriptional repressor
LFIREALLISSATLNLGRKADQVRRFVLREVAAGRFAATEPLPPEAEIASSFGVCRNTVRRAFFELEKQGVIRRIRGKGTFLRPQNTVQRPAQLAAFALILPEVRRSLYPSLVRGFGRAAGERTQQVMVCQTDNSVPKQADTILQLLDKRVAGVAIVPTTTPETPTYHIRVLQDHDIPVVFCHRSVAGTTAPCITWDAGEVGRMAGRFLLDCGHKRMSFLSLVARYPLSQSYADGFRQVLEAHGRHLAAEHVNFGEGAASDCARAWDRMFTGPSAPSAVFCHDDVCAEELYMWAMGKGMRIPDDLSIIAAGDANREGGIRTRLACVTIDEDRLGRTAADLLHELTAGGAGGGHVNGRGSARILVPLGLSEGETVARI